MSRSVRLTPHPRMRSWSTRESVGEHDRGRGRHERERVNTIEIVDTTESDGGAHAEVGSA
eukprot:3860740-Pyramimonas_sp.AAC.1